MDPNRAYGQSRRGAVACTGKRRSLGRRATSKPAPVRGRLRSGRALLTLQGDADRFTLEARAGKGV